MMEVENEGYSITSKFNTVLFLVRYEKSTTKELCLWL